MHVQGLLQGPAGATHSPTCDFDPRVDFEYMAIGEPTQHVACFFPPSPSLLRTLDKMSPDPSVTAKMTKIILSLGAPGDGSILTTPLAQPFRSRQAAHIPTHQNNITALRLGDLVVALFSHVYYFTISHACITTRMPPSSVEHFRLRGSPGVS